MKYIKITNEANNVNRLKLEKLGFSTKRDDENTIGQFGSGIKFAPIAAARKGIEFIFAGQDDKGEYTLEYIVKEEDGIPCIFYKYGDYEKPSSFTSEAGMLSWESDFQIYREVVANAIDEAKISGNPWSCEVVDVNEILPVNGEFSVYLTATENLLEIHNNFDKYFSVNREPLYDNRGAKIYSSIDDVFRVYCKGVLVFSADKTFKSYSGESEVSGFYDYELGDELELNEERTVSNTFHMNSLIVKTLAYASNDGEKSYLSKDIISKLISMNEDNIDDYYETKFIAEYSWSSYSTYCGYKTLEVFNTLYPDTIIATAQENNYNFRATANSRGFDVLQINFIGSYQFLLKAGAKTYESLFGIYFKHELTQELHFYPVLSSAMNIIKEVIPDFAEVDGKVAVYFDEIDKNTLGLTASLVFDDEEEPTPKILINANHAETANITEMISTFIHEWDHFRSGLGDGNDASRAFRELADVTIGNLVYELWKTKKKVDRK